MSGLQQAGISGGLNDAGLRPFDGCLDDFHWRTDHVRQLGRTNRKRSTDGSTQAARLIRYLVVCGGLRVVV